VPLVYEPEPCYNPNFSDNDYSHDLPGVTPRIDHHCCYKCGNSLNDFLCHQCTCEFCGNGAHVGYNFPAQIPSIQTLPSFPQQYPCCEDCGDLPEAYQWPDNSLSMEDKHLDTILATESDEFIKSSVESLVPIPSESEGIPDNMCDVPSHDNSPPLDVSKNQFEDFYDSNDGSTSTDDDSFSIDNIEYVEASPPNSELVSSEVMEIVIPESSSTSLNSLLEETSTFDNFLAEFKTFCFDLEEISSGSTTTYFDISLPDYEVFYDDHVKEISSGRNEDIISDPGICSYHIYSFRLDVSHRSGTFIKFKVLNESPMEISFSTCSHMDQ
nr:hypothetical protein [Tanacetum cinerariifolium]